VEEDVLISAGMGFSHASREVGGRTARGRKNCEVEALDKVTKWRACDTEPDKRGAKKQSLLEMKNTNVFIFGAQVVYIVCWSCSNTLQMAGIGVYIEPTPNSSWCC
jgi:hypothetical protein